jgi:hypothetical protein
MTPEKSVAQQIKSVINILKEKSLRRRKAKK